MKASKRNLRKKLSRNAKKAKLEKQVNPIIEKETADTNNDKNNQDELGHDERVDIFYDPNKVSKGDIFIDEIYIRVLHIAELEV